MILNYTRQIYYRFSHIKKNRHGTHVFFVYVGLSEDSMVKSGKAYLRTDGTIKILLSKQTCSIFSDDLSSTINLSINAETLKLYM